MIDDIDDISISRLDLNIASEGLVHAHFLFTVSLAKSCQLHGVMGLKSVPGDLGDLLGARDGFQFMVTGKGIEKICKTHS